MKYQTEATGTTEYQQVPKEDHDLAHRAIIQIPKPAFVDSSIKGLYIDRRRRQMMPPKPRPQIIIPEGIEFKQQNDELSIKFERRFVPDDERYWVTILVGIALTVTFLVATGGREPWLLGVVAIFLGYFWMKKDRIKDSGTFEISIEGGRLRSIEAGEITQHFMVGDLSGIECRNMGAGNYTIYLNLKGHNRPRYFCFLNTQKYGDFVKAVIGSQIRPGGMIPMKKGCGSGCSSC